MVTKRIIPCLDVCNSRVVKGKRFKNIKDVDDPCLMAKYYSDMGADEIVFYDITATVEERSISLEFISKVAKNINIPFSVGGGVSTLEDFTELLRKGADKVSINSAAVINPKLIKEASLKFGTQCVVVSIDAKKNLSESWNVYIRGGKEDTKVDAIQWAKNCANLGAGEIVVNSIDEDGMKSGYDLELLNRISNAVNIPVIASGGAGKLEDFYEVFNKTNVDGALAASAFHYKEIEIQNLKKYLIKKGVYIREF